MKYRTLAIAPLLLGLAMSPQLLAAAKPANEVIALYDGVAPGSETWTQKEGSQDLEDTRFNPPNPDTIIWNVTRPTLTVFRPAKGKSNGTAIVIAPGGGFRVLSFKNEGLRVAQYLADHGYTAFVLKYRTNKMADDPAEMERTLKAMMPAAPGGAAPGGAAPGGAAPGGARPAGGPPAGMPAGMPGGAPGGMPGMAMGPVELAAISDGKRALELVRSRAQEFGIAANRVGIIGFSAGGAVSGGTAIAASGRPDFVGIIYSGVAGAIPAGAPPAFLAAAADDGIAAGMPDLFNRWRQSGANAELHIYSKGQHGFGTAKQNLPVDGWLDSFHAWVKQQGFVPATTR